MAKLSLAQLKRDANSGKMSLEMTYRFGEPIPDRYKGIRPVLRANTVALFLRNGNGAESQLRLNNATLVQYDGKRLSIFAPGKRINDNGRPVTDWNVRGKLNIQYDVLFLS